MTKASAGAAVRWSGAGTVVALVLHCYLVVAGVVAITCNHVVWWLHGCYMASPERSRSPFPITSGKKIMSSSLASSGVGSIDIDMEARSRERKKGAVKMPIRLGQRQVRGVTTET